MSDHDFPSSPLGSRRHARQRLKGLDTPFGVILDVSESGACVFRKGPTSVSVGDQIELKVRHGEIELDLAAAVVRTQSLGFRRTEVGVEFISPTDQQRAGLRALAAKAGTDFSPSVWLAA